MALKHRRAAGSERKARRPEQREGAGERKGAPSSRWKDVKFYLTPYTAGVAALALAAALFNSSHLHTLFENDRFFSHLSTLERELSFRTEMGLYYSYYKTLVTAPSFTGGLESILRDNLTEYPSTINTLQRFNLYPEVVVGGLFRLYRSGLGLLGLRGVGCLSIRRGLGLPPVQACNGLGDPFCFYVSLIFSLNGLLAAGLTLLGCYLSQSLLGGVLSTLAFFYNHGEATRVMWTPPLRESFAMPFLLLQLLALTHVLRHREPSWSQFLALMASTLTFLLPWQLFVAYSTGEVFRTASGKTLEGETGNEATTGSPPALTLTLFHSAPPQFAPFSLLTQMLSLLVVHSLRFMSAHKFLFILSSLGTAFLLNILLQFANTLLLTSYFASCLLSCMLIALVHKVSNKLTYIPLILLWEGSLVVLGTAGGKLLLTALLGVQDDAHIGAILRSKLTSYRNFHTQLYTCSPEFDFLPPEYALKLSATLLLPVVAVVGVGLGGVILGRLRGWGLRVQLETKEGSGAADHLPEVRQCYHLVQAAAFAAMAVLIMRLKLFLTPQLTLLASLLALPKVVWFIPTRWRQWVLVLVLLGSSVKGVLNLLDQRSIIGEFNSPGQEELMQWVNSSTLPSAVFAGTMPTMAAIKLSAERPIVNHPHYEDSGLRNRTKNVYTIFSRKPPSEIHSILRGMGVNYVIVEESWCTKQYRPGCAFHEVWDEEDPANQDRPVFCKLLRQYTPLPFKQVFLNKTYRVLQVQ